jgi:hypothetical protein
MPQGVSEKEDLRLANPSHLYKVERGPPESYSRLDMLFVGALFLNHQGEFVKGSQTHAMLPGLVFIEGVFRLGKSSSPRFFSVNP